MKTKFEINRIENKFHLGDKFKNANGNICEIVSILSRGGEQCEITFLVNKKRLTVDIGAVALGLCMGFLEHYEGGK